MNPSPLSDEEHKTREAKRQEILARHKTWTEDALREFQMWLERRTGPVKALKAWGKGMPNRYKAPPF